MKAAPHAFRETARTAVPGEPRHKRALSPSRFAVQHPKPSPTAPGSRVADGRQPENGKTADMAQRGEAGSPGSPRLSVLVNSTAQGANMGESVKIGNRRRRRTDHLDPRVSGMRSARPRFGRFAAGRRRRRFRTPRLSCSGW